MVQAMEDGVLVLVFLCSRGLRGSSPLSLMILAVVVALKQSPVVVVEVQVRGCETESQRRVTGYGTT